jgi:hypothetical protein
MAHDNENEAVGQPEEVSDASITVTTKCLNVVDQYRAVNICKGDAIYEFSKAIPAGEAGAAESPGKTLQAYIVMLDNWDHERTLSDTDEHQEEAQEDTSSDYGGRKHKRAERGVRDKKEDKCDEPVHRRPKIDPELFPWTVSDRIEGGAMRDERAATQDLIANYFFNIKLTKMHLLNSGAAPEFPDTEWKSLLSRLTINLDTVFSGQYSTEHDPKITHEIGDFTISGGHNI